MISHLARAFALLFAEGSPNELTAWWCTILETESCPGYSHEMIVSTELS